MATSFLSFCLCFDVCCLLAEIRRWYLSNLAVVERAQVEACTDVVCLRLNKRAKGLTRISVRKSSSRWRHNDGKKHVNSRWWPNHFEARNASNFFFFFFCCYSGNCTTGNRYIHDLIARSSFEKSGFRLTVLFLIINPRWVWTEMTLNAEICPDNYKLNLKSIGNILDLAVVLFFFVLT